MLIIIKDNAERICINGRSARAIYLAYSYNENTLRTSDFTGSEWLVDRDYRIILEEYKDEE